MLESEAYKQLTDQDAGLGFPPATVYDPNTTAPSLHASVSAFRDEKRLDATYRELRDEFVLSASNATVAIGTLVANRDHIAKAARVAGRTSAMLRINLPHIQIISWSWSLNLSWPASVLALRDTIGAFFSLDLMTPRGPSAWEVGRWSPRRNFGTTSVAVMGFVFVLLLILGVKSLASSRRTRSWKRRVRHISCTTYTAASLAFPLLITQVAKWLDWSQLESGMWTSNEVPHVTNSHTWEMELAVGIASFWLLVLVVAVPLKTLRTLRHKYEAGL